MKNPNKPHIRIANAVFERRTLLGISQAQLGKSSGVSQTHISAFESGRRSMSLRKLYSVLWCLGLELDIRFEVPDEV
jgi:transcriptional regulator with XRE-family HTH domain